MRQPGVFSPQGGLGRDSLSPTMLRYVSAAAREGCAKVLDAAEELQFWPGGATHTLLAAGPKPGSNDYRRIGLLTLVYRVWPRVRSPVVRGWAQRNQSLLLWVCVGKVV